MPLLAISGLGAESSQLHEQGLYWLACDAAEDATLLCRQVIEGMPEDARAALIAEPQAMGDVLGALDAAQGPAELALFETTPQSTRHLLQDLPRLAPRKRVLVLLAPADAWAGDAAEQWCNALRPALLAEAALLLVISGGQGTALVERLRAHNQPLDGLAQVYRGKGGVRYLQHFWSNPLGKTATRDMELVRLAGGFAAAAMAPVPIDAGGDELLCLAQRPVLEGAPAFSAHWQVHESLEDLSASASRAVSATVIFAIDAGQRLDNLARQLHRLRQLRGNALKLVVREMAPTLRYQDEQLLLACGATLIVPFGASLSRFLTMVESIQGYVWRRHLPSDFDALLARLRPQAICGLVAPRAFADAVQSMWQGVRNGEIVHQLLVLRPAPGLTPRQACSRTVFRRDGDIACVVGDVLFLFLFACRSEGVEQALDHIFQLSWKELFVSQELLVDIDSLTSPAFLDSSLPQQPRPDPAAQVPTQAWPTLAPRKVALAKRGGA